MSKGKRTTAEATRLEFLELKKHWAVKDLLEILDVAPKSSKEAAKYMDVYRLVASMVDEPAFRQHWRAACSAGSQWGLRSIHYTIDRYVSLRNSAALLPREKPKKISWDAMKDSQLKYMLFLEVDEDDIDIWKETGATTRDIDAALAKWQQKAFAHAEEKENEYYEERKAGKG